MTVARGMIEQLARIPNVAVSEGTLLSEHTRFGIGGPAKLYLEASTEPSFSAALRLVQSNGAIYCVIGAGTNLIVSDEGFDGIVLRFTGDRISRDDVVVRAEAGAELQALVDYCIANGLRGLETMTGIPGSVGAAVYGNAGAYGHSIDERVERVRFLDGDATRSFTGPECRFHYRESIFKEHKDWIILDVELRLTPAPAAELRQVADDILKIRLAKYPASMKCAGSIFKNLILAELAESVRREIPARVVREGKAPSAYFLEEVGAKGMRCGGMRVADYHANLIYNEGGGTARELCFLIGELKSRVLARFGLELAEEVQYVGFPAAMQRA
ncbi:MAG TPA: UDP-N-acetylmuramate dehydrogenase [Bryobacteraceae bacterium]|nr:UDP-N-acetylmuramate dehydrogenase [Bryobacteraceae bacterium]